MSGLHAAFEERLGSADFEAYADSDDGLGSIMARIEGVRQHGFDLSIAEAMALQRERPATFKRR